MMNHYIPQLSTIKEVIKHTDLEYTFRMTFEGDVKPGQFFELSIPKYGEAPISVSGIGEGTVDFTIRRVGKVTNEIFENYVGDTFFIRGPYGNGFEIENYDFSTWIINGIAYSKEFLILDSDMTITAEYVYSPTPISLANDYFRHGKISVKGPDLVDAKGEKLQLIGLSTHGLQWFGKYVNKPTFAALKMPTELMLLDYH